MIRVLHHPLQPNTPDGGSTRILRRRRVRRGDDATDSYGAYPFHHQGWGYHGYSREHRKTEGPATAMVILGLHYCSQKKICKLDPAKVIKYAGRPRSMLRAGHTTSKDLER